MRRAVFVLAVLAFALSVASLVFQLVTISQTQTERLTARASNSGIASFCINHPPSLTVPCNSTMSQDSPYFCQLLINDTDNNALVVTRAFSAGNASLTVSLNGTIDFTPTNDDVGNHTVVFTVTDDSGCENDATSVPFNFSVANINDPPFLVQNISDQSLPTNTTLSAFFLTNIFDDPDRDVLNFTSTQPSGITVTILNTSEVLFTSNVCRPDGELLFFTATDPFGASADSNVFSITVTCASQAPSQASSGSGGGGGGGGGVSTTCRSEWECDEWLPCLPMNVQWRRCYDLNGCEDPKHLKRACTYEGPPVACEENWLCSEWGNCVTNGTQYRDCEDLAGCGSEIVKPPEEQHCTYIATCNDGLQNGDEEGVDCGGSCAACVLVQKPSPISTSALSTWLVLLIIFAILLASGILRYYKGELAQLLARASFLLRHDVYKEILLTAAQRRSLFERLSVFEQMYQQAQPEMTHDTLATLLRGYVRDALNVPAEALPEEVTARCSELKLHKETTAMITGLFSKVTFLEQEEIEYDEYFVLATLEQLRTVVCLTSDYTHDEIARSLEELSVTEEMSFYDEIFARTVNILRAVQFQQLDAARQEYIAMVSRYDGLTDLEKEAIYPELLWSFQTTKFQSEISGTRVIEKV